MNLSIPGVCELPLDVYRHLPDGLVQLAAHELLDMLPRPTLIHVDGGCEPELFVSVLLHGNETSGWEGIRRYLQDHPVPARSLSLFIANVEAAAHGLRVLPHQQDFNRIWRNAQGDGRELADALTQAIASRNYFAAVDLHNNTGHNPYYSVVTELAPENLALAFEFSDKAVFIREPDTTLTQAFTGRCPAVALELGPVGDPLCADRVYDFIHRLLALEEITAGDVAGLSLYESLARVHVRDQAEFAFTGNGAAAPLMLTGGVEAVNFHELRSGTPFGASELPLNELLQVLDSEHRDVTEQFFGRDGEDIVLVRDVVPAMYTTDPMVVRQDCLCYFMTRMQI
jgi:hypothetical protein